MNSRSSVEEGKYDLQAATLRPQVSQHLAYGSDEPSFNQQTSPEEEIMGPDEDNDFIPCGAD
jgi:hypothetical protein